MTITAPNNLPTQDWHKRTSELGVTPHVSLQRGEDKTANKAVVEKQERALATLVHTAIDGNAAALVAVAAGSTPIAAQAPQLMQPASAVVSQPATARAFLQEVDKEQGKLAELSKDPAYAALISAVMGGTAAPGKLAGARVEGSAAGKRDMPAVSAADGDIGGFFGNDRLTNLLLLVTQTLQDSQRAELKLQSTMVKVARSAAERQSETLVNQGKEILGSSISSGVLQTSLSGAGAAQKFKGLSRQRNSIERNLMPAADSRRLRGAGERAVLGAAHATDELKFKNESLSLQVKQPGGQLTGKDIAPSSKVLQERHANALLEGSPEQMHVEENLRLLHEKNETHWQRLHINGGMLESAGQVMSRQAESTGAMMQKNEQSQQTLAQNSEEVSRSAANLHQESAQKFRELMQKVHEAVNQIVGNDSAVAGQIASNLKI